MQPFQFLSPGTLDFGPGRIDRLPGHILRHGRSILILRGGTSLEISGSWEKIRTLLRDHAISWKEAQIHGEPSPADIDAICSTHRHQDIDCVVAIGGGSVLDGGKAVAAMLGMSGTVKDYLEKVGHKRPEPRRVPLIAIPTTSGTGSEATKNAVLSEVGPEGFKASLRHDSYIPDIALIDPLLMTGCPAGVTAAAGMDALSQLLESFLSTRGTALTEALAISGLDHIARAFPGVCDALAMDPEARANMAYAAYLSGLTLANAGLGTVHGIAGVLGGFYPVPHGRICGVLLAPIMKKTLEKLPVGHPALAKMNRAGEILTGCSFGDLHAGAGALVRHLEHLQRATGLSRLTGLALSAEDVDRIGSYSGNKNNPVALTADELKTILQACSHP